MLSAFASAFRTPDLRKKLLFTLGIIAIFRLGSVVPTPGVDYKARPDLHRRSCRTTATLRADQPVQRRRAAAAVGVRAGDHAVHHREHHHPAAHRGDPAARGLQAGGPGRPGEAHPVHPLPDHRPGDPAVHGHHRPRPQPRRAVPGLHRSRSCTTRRSISSLHDGHHDDRGHRRDHVARRAHHRPRRRQRHVAADLHLDHRRRSPASSGRSRTSNGALTLALIAVDRLRRSWPASSSSSRPSAASRCSTPSGWSAAGMYGGTSTYIPLKVNMAGVIPVIFASSLLYMPAADRPALRHQQHVGWRSGSQRTSRSGDHPLYMLVVLPADHLLHLLLRRDHVQPGRGRRQHEAVRRLHPRHPRRAARPPSTSTTS